MIAKELRSITLTDIEELIDSGVREGKTVEYKQVLPGRTDAEKKEFLADVSSFANASGGDILYGISETRDIEGKTTGIPDGIVGLAGINADQEIRRLEQTIQTGLEPRIPGLAFHLVEGHTNGSVMVIRIPKSWAAPHMITFQSSPRFYARSSVGKMPLGVPEIRAAFVQSESVPERTRRFREDRLGQIIAGEIPVPIGDTALIVLHMVPLSSFFDGPQIDVLRFLDGNPLVMPMGGSGADHRLNIDGYISFNKFGEPRNRQFNYIQVFRNGAIEAVDSFVLSNTLDKGIPSVSLEKDVLMGASLYIKAYQEIGIEAPIVLMLSLLNVAGFYMLTPMRVRTGIPHYIDKRHLIIPDVVIEDLAEPVDKIFQPVFDLLWQACGYRRCFDYQDGRWKPQ